jgi:cytochrome c peroxidase
LIVKIDGPGLAFMNYLSALFLLVFLLITSFLPGRKPTSVSKVELGKMLFFDPILSGDSSISCGSCHKPDFYFADTVALSQGIKGNLTRRNTPSVLNMANRDRMFWDGRAGSLQEQVLFPIRDPNEMNLPISKAISRLKNSKRYRSLFYSLYKRSPDEKSLSEVIAAYEQTLETGNSRFDLYMADKATFSKDERAGHALFVGKAKCFDCHFSPDFTGDEFKNIGLYNGQDWDDSGRFEITKRPADLGKFKVPGLRNVAKTAPYMHNGRFKTLREVIDYYANPARFVTNPINTDSTISNGLNLNELEKTQLEAFLNTLTSESKTIFK